MAKTMTTMVSDWTEADQALMRIGQIERSLTNLELGMNKTIDRAKESKAAAAEPLLREKKVLERDLEKFCVKNREGFGGAKSRVLNFGTVRFREASKLVIHSVSNTLAGLKSLLGTGAERFIRTREEPDKEALETMPDETLSRIGVTRKKEEKFGYEVDQAKIEEL